MVRTSPGEGQAKHVANQAIRSLRRAEKLVARSFPSYCLITRPEPEVWESTVGLPR